MAIPIDIPLVKCGQCAYDLRGLPGTHCPECGGDLRAVGWTTEKTDTEKQIRKLRNRADQLKEAGQTAGIVVALVVVCISTAIVASQFKPGWIQWVATFPVGILTGVAYLIARDWTKPKVRKLREQADELERINFNEVAVAMREHLLAAG